MTKHIGTLEVITGSMFSGKSEELIRRIRRARYAKQKLLVFSPSIDNRYGENGIYSHDKSNFKAYSISNINQMYELLYANPDVEVIGIDEIQFFDKKIVEFCETCVSLGKRVVVAGLDLDFRAIPFEPLPYLMAIADKVDKLSAICTVCGNRAYASQRLIDSMPAYDDDPLVAIGSTEQYEARCRLHHIVRKRTDILEKIEIIINLDNVDLTTINFKNENILDLVSKNTVKNIKDSILNRRNNKEKVVINIKDSIAKTIEGNYRILDMIFDLMKISNISIIFEKESSINNFITTYDLLNRSEINVDKVYIKNIDKDNFDENILEKLVVIGG